MFETDDGRRIELPEGLTPEEERAIVMALERYFVAENPKPAPWVLQGRIEATGYGALQVRRFAREPWHGQWVEFARKGVPPVHGRSDVQLGRRGRDGDRCGVHLLARTRARRCASEAGSAPRSWGNGPGDTYGEHEHERDKVLFCLDGSIVFHMNGEDLSLEAGDRLDLPAGTRHGGNGRTGGLRVRGSVGTVRAGVFTSTSCGSPRRAASARTSASCVSRLDDDDVESCRISPRWPHPPPTMIRGAPACNRYGRPCARVPVVGGRAPAAPAVAVRPPRCDSRNQSRGYPARSCGPDARRDRARSRVRHVPRGLPRSMALALPGRGTDRRTRRPR